MTRPELHALADIVMDAREKHGNSIQLVIGRSIEFYHIGKKYIVNNYKTFSDFTQAVKEYIKTLENK